MVYFLLSHSLNVQCIGVENNFTIEIIWKYQKEKKYFKELGIKVVNNIYQPSPLGQDMTQGQFLSEV